MVSGISANSSSAVPPSAHAGQQQESAATLLKELNSLIIAYILARMDGGSTQEIQSQINQVVEQLKQADSAS